MSKYILLSVVRHQDAPGKAALAIQSAINDHLFQRLEVLREPLKTVEIAHPLATLLRKAPRVARRGTWRLRRRCILKCRNVRPTSFSCSSVITSIAHDAMYYTKSPSCGIGGKMTRNGTPPERPHDPLSQTTPYFAVKLPPTLWLKYPLLCG